MIAVRQVLPVRRSPVRHRWHEYRLYSSSSPPPDLMWALMWTRDIINPRDEDWDGVGRR